MVWRKRGNKLSKFEKPIDIYIFMCYNINIIKQKTKYIERLKGDYYERDVLKKKNIVVRFEQVNNKRTITTLENHGCTYTEEKLNISSANDGNEKYKNLISEGYKKCSKSEYDKIIEGWY